jgi:hypothetical protein
MYVFYRFYYKPRAEIKKYKHILQKLGYKVYEQEFAFFGISFMNENNIRVVLTWKERPLFHY